MVLVLRHSNENRFKTWKLSKRNFAISAAVSLQCIDVVQASTPQTPYIEPCIRVHFLKDRFLALVLVVLEFRLTPDKQTCLPLLHSVRLALGPGAGQVALIPL